MNYAKDQSRGIASTGPPNDNAPNGQVHIRLKKFRLAFQPETDILQRGFPGVGIRSVTPETERQKNCLGPTPNLLLD
jgi:hypothetical protein